MKNAGLDNIDQAKDLMKYTGLSSKELAKRLENSSIESILGIDKKNLDYLMKKTNMSEVDILAELKKQNISIEKINGLNVDEIVKKLDKTSASKMPEITAKFNYKSKYDEVAFANQLKNQEKGLNDLTIAEFIENRKKYNGAGRSKEASKLQKELREKFKQDKIDELFESGLNYDDAIYEAKKWMKTQAILHDPDQIAGGNPLNLTGIGDKNINSSIGSQWRYRIDDLEKQVMDFANTIPKSEWSNVKLNIKLTY